MLEVKRERDEHASARPPYDRLIEGFFGLDRELPFPATKIGMGRDRNFIQMSYQKFFHPLT
jgi:hypothetical protein